MAELKRFIHTSSKAWKGVANKSDYNNSIVFIHDDDKGVSIYTQGATFDTELTAAEVEPMVKAYLEAGQNVTITEKDGKLVIAAPGTNTITAESTELVQANAVAGAFSGASSSLIYTPTESGASSYTFQQKFTKLDGTQSVEYPTIKVTEGTNVKLDASADEGLVISATDTTYSAGTGLTLAEGNVFKHTNTVDKNTESKSDVKLGGDVKTFDFDQYSYDTEGHITDKVTNVVTLPETAFKDTTYEVTMVAAGDNEVSLNTKKDGQAESNYTIKGDKGTTVSFKDNVMTITSDTASDILGTLNVTDTAVANQYVSEVDQTNGKIEVTRATLPVYGVSETAVDGLKLSLTDGKVGLVDDGLAADLTSKNITLETAATATEGYLKTYVLKQGATEIGKIDLPKELVVTGGSVVEKDGEKYLRLNIANQDEPVDIAVKDLVDVYTAGNGIAISDANVVSAKVKEGETYLKVGADGLYTEGIDTAITTEIAKLDGSATATTNATEGIVNVLTSVVEADGIISLGAETAVATATYVDNAIKDLDSQKGADATAADLKTDEIAVVTGVDVTQENGVITSVAVDSAKVATTTYVDNAIKGLDSNVGTVGAETATVIADGSQPNTSQMFSKIVIEDGKLVASKCITSFVDRAAIEAYGTKTTTTVKENYIGLVNSDSIAEAFAKSNAAWDWGTI